MNKDVIIACDFSDKKQTMKFLDLFTGNRPYVKIGMELFYSQGPDIVREIKKRGHKIFLDLKLHDIPNTVEKAMRSLSVLDVNMVNFHAAGTKKMVEAAIKGLTRADGTRPLCIGVTQLTSTSQSELNDEILISYDMDYTVKQYAKLVKSAGADGVVCSPLEAIGVKKECGDTFITVTPGIRFFDSAQDDQHRIMTPLKARTSGCDYIVVGRPITAAKNPLSAYERCVNEFMYGKESV